MNTDPYQSLARGVEHGPHGPCVGSQRTRGSPNACRGLPKRTPALLQVIMLDMEYTQINPQQQPWVGVASLDAVKCFDLLAYPLVVKSAQRLHIPTSILAALVSFWCDALLRPMPTLRR